MIVQMHSTLRLLDEVPADPSVFGVDFDEPDYSIEGFGDAKLKKAASEGIQSSNQKKNRVKSAMGPVPGSESKKRPSGKDAGIPSQGPPISRSISGPQPTALKFNKRLESAKPVSSSANNPFGGKDGRDNSSGVGSSNPYIRQSNETPPIQPPPTNPRKPKLVKAPDQDDHEPSNGMERMVKHFNRLPF